MDLVIACREYEHSSSQDVDCIYVHVCQGGRTRFDAHMMQFCIPEIPSRRVSASTQKHGIGNSLFAPKTSRPQYDPSADDEPHDCVCVLSVGEPFHYVIPSFDVIAIEMRQLKVKGYTGKYGLPVCFNTVTAIASFAPSPGIWSTRLDLAVAYLDE